MSTLAAILGIVLELAPGDKVPGAYFQTKFGVGAASTGEPKYLLVVGSKAASGGTYTADTTPVDIYQDADADTYFGAGSEAARMCYAALKVGGVRIKAGAAAITSGAAATATLTIGGTWTTTGTWSLRIAGTPLVGGILASDTPETLSAAIADAINDDPRLPMRAAAASGSGGTYVITLTARSQGTRGNKLLVWQDKSALPSGATSVLAGGTAVGNGAVPLSGGSGTENVTTLLTALMGGRYWRIAIAQQDATNLGRWVTQLDTKAGPMVSRTEHAITGVAADLSTAGALAQGVDNQRFCMLWKQDSEAPMPDLVAEFAAARVQREQQNPNQNYDGLVLKSASPQTDAATNPTNHATQVAALDFGLTPLVTDRDLVKVLRAVTTRTLNGSAVDNGTVDVADSAVADAVRDELWSFWTNDFVVANPYLEDDPAPEDQPLAQGTAYPALWSALATTSVLKRLERANWITRVDKYPIVSQLNPNSVTERIVFYCPCIRRPHQHQIEGTIAQTVFSANR